MSLEHFKTQVLLLHSEQSTLDRLSSGFSDRYTVHCATSGSEALNTLGEIQIDVIVTAQDLPGMSGLEALREAKKRSPETIGILLAGNDDEDVEALVGDQEVFQIVRGSVTPDSLKSLIDGVTRQARLLALAQSANDTTANLDEPMGEHIVMETSENGSTIISDGTGRMPRLDPKKIAAAANIGARSVDVLVLTRDDEFLATVKESARGLHNIIYANTVSQADDAVREHKIGVAVIDAAMVGSNVEDLTLHLRSSSERLVSIVAGRRDDGEMLMDLINRGKVYRFLLKPVSPGRSRLAIEASVRHHLEGPDSAFKKADKGAPMSLDRFDLVPEIKPDPGPATKSRKESPAVDEKKKTVKADEPKPARVTTLPVPDKPEAGHPDRPAASRTGKPGRRESEPAQASGIVARRDDALSPLDERFGDEFGGSDTSFTETVTGLVHTIGKSLFGRKKVAESAEPAPIPKLEPTITKAEPAPKKAEPTVTKAEPPAKKAEPTITRTEPPAKKAEPTITKTEPPAKKVEPAAKKPKPAAKKPKPAAKKAEPPLKKREPRVRKAEPAPVKQAEPPLLKAEPAPIGPLAAAGSGGSLVRKPMLMGIGVVLIVAIVGVSFWLFRGAGAPTVTPAAVDDSSSAGRVSITEAEPVLDATEPEQAPAAEPAEEPVDLGPDIDALLEEPRRAVEDGRIYEPEGQNAIELYLGARDTVPGNETVESEFAATIDKALGMVETALLEQRFDDAELALRQVALADPDNARLPFLNAQLKQTRLRYYIDSARVAIRDSRFEDAKLALDGARDLAGGDTDEVSSVADDLAKALSQQRVGDLLARANSRLEEGKLVAPSNDNARYYFESALSNDPDNAAARQGLITVASKLVLHARTQIDAGNLDAADDLLADARRLDPAGSELDTAEKALKDARDREEQKRIAARKAQEEREAAERQAQAEREAAERQAAERQAAERAAAEKAAAEAQAADLAAAELAAAQRATAARAAAQKGTTATPKAATTPAASQPAPAKSTPARRDVASDAEPSQSTPSRAAQEPATTPQALSRNDQTGSPPRFDAPAAQTPAQTAFQPQRQESPAAASPPPTSSSPVSLSTLKRTRYVPPKYPYSAERRGISGWVDVIFTVDIDGTVRDATVSNADPPSVFNSAALNAVEGWEFEPVIENGVAIQKRAAVRMMFTVE